MSASHDLKVGECHCVSGLQRYGAKYLSKVPWQCDDFEPLPSPVHPPPGSPSDVPFDTLQDDVNSESDALLVQFDEHNGNGNGSEAGFEPAQATDELWDDSEDDEIDEDSQDSQDRDDETDGIPRIAPWRLNLTALSQRYNMYAVAYRGEVHISRIRSCVDHTVPTVPDLILEPPTSQLGESVGGYIDRDMPHQINHLIIGELGTEEILLLAYDDGDVIGYYNFQIEKALLYAESGNALEHSAPVTPFFHQNTGISTWGLAIHKQSRLIATSNNSSEVHMFAFALSPNVLPDEHLTSGQQGFICERRKYCNPPDPSFADLRARRSVNYYFIFEIPGHNIPNVAFSNDTDGSADKVLAIDIRQRLWVLDIWSSHSQCIRGLYDSYATSETRELVPRGWGILVLPQSSFLPTSSFKESLGLEPDEANYVFHKRYGYYIGIEKAFAHIKNNSIIHPWVRASYGDDLSLMRIMGVRLRRTAWHDDTRIDCWNAKADLEADGSVENPPIPCHNRPTYTGAGAVILRDGSSVMRTYETDIELVGSNTDVGIMFPNSISQIKPREHPPRLHFAGERLAHLIHVPELYLIAAGSMCGRVALITLTRPRNPHYSFKRGFKIEAILPRGTDESRQLRSISPLLGVTVGPIYTQSLGERRYRIILQYYDHRVLAYEIYRNDTTEELFVI
ncbi:hypothetical protein NPX13_g2175 [Xylaria arbuscula]|uniref:Uncharacterized protein n=1 Tax=Xylaria arbuscula TaxID=114810 RepID=A0A9W8NJN6_9PEZI|nr:hypothetical protein NPX13_g2175 [Xylaria arbuscula]